MKKINNLFILITLFVSILECSDPKLSQNSKISDHQECVVLIHGFLRSSNHLKHLKNFLIENGYYVVSIDYESTSMSIPEIADSYLSNLTVHCQNQKIHFVTHSLGGILLRSYLKRNQIKHLGKIVMLAPPNKGSEVADFLSKFKLINSMLGPVVSQLKTDQNSYVNSLGLPNFQFGIIMGNLTLDPISSYLIPGDDDGKVSIENSKLENMSDFLLVERTHNFIVDAPEVKQAILNYFKTGKFQN
ncbi:esterase/lipase family protein [Leptospira jelokensis]|uniref:Alpha/beta hydrolase n=1 Tax=Leptospira jelokensis TaxID=2484931 RepID=A0A4Z0ZZ86_9LEPT|nr:alpha/beta hydrolase [Leptospira jelokensis]TGL65613.1 alpha/beta hydrolase [Leptospira jelokensis]TGM02186.1 alpha/beta hydrolase [Leptospira jelokensis]